MSAFIPPVLLWLFAKVAAACSPPGHHVRLLTPPSESLGVWIESVMGPPDFTLEVDGVEVGGDVREELTPHPWGRNYALFTPDAPFVEGQSWRFTALSGIGEPAVTEGLVVPVDAPAPPALVGVAIGERLEDVPCFGSGWHTSIDLSVSEGEGLVVVDDEPTGDRVLLVFSAGEPVETSLLRDGRSGQETCLTSLVLLADGSETPGDTVCSAGCGCANGGRTAATPLVLLLLLGRRRSPFGKSSRSISSASGIGVSDGPTALHAAARSAWRAEVVVDPVEVARRKDADAVRRAERSWREGSAGRTGAGGPPGAPGPTCSSGSSGPPACLARAAGDRCACARSWSDAQRPPGSRPGWRRLRGRPRPRPQQPEPAGALDPPGRTGARGRTARTAFLALTLRSLLVRAQKKLGSPRRSDLGGKNRVAPTS